MTQQSWNNLTLFEQLSNIDGDVERLIRAHEKFISGKTSNDNTEFYLENIIKLIKMTILDDKNSVKGYLAIELYDEVDEIREYIKGNRTADYIRRYWNEYTNALSAMR